MKSVSTTHSHDGTEELGNQFILKCLLFTIVALLLVWIFGKLGIFIVDMRLMTTGLVPATLILMIPFAICKVFGTSKPWLKYVILLFVIIGTTIVGMTLTYHSLLFSALPLFYAMQYMNKKVIYYTYLLTLISISVIVMGGYYFGLCDANMLFLTTKPLSNYANLETGAIYLKTINPNPWFTLPLYFILPRCITLLLFVPVIQHITNSIAQNAVSLANMKKLSETDEMTGLFNKNKYLQMVTEFYPSVPEVGVIFWDINNLKEINDTTGHIHGDYLIANIATSISQLTTPTNKAYRIGGDEFILILENATPDDVAATLLKWEHIINRMNATSALPLSAAVGSSHGLGQNIMGLINEADEKMYFNKQAKKEASQN